MPYGTPQDRRPDDIDDYLDRKAEAALRHPWKTTTRVVLILTLIIGGFSIAHWGFGVGTAKVVGQGEAYKSKVSSSNWVQQQAAFQQLFGNIRTADENLTTDTIALDHFNKVHPNYNGNGQAVDPVLDQQNTLNNAVAADLQSCHGSQNDYVAKGNSYLSEDFRDHGLPKTFVETDPGWATPPQNAAFIDYDCVAGTTTTPYPAHA